MQNRFVIAVHPTAEDAANAAALLGISIPTLPEMQEIEPSARLYEEVGAQFMTVPIVVGLDGDAPRRRCRASCRAYRPAAGDRRAA